MRALVGLAPGGVAVMEDDEAAMLYRAGYRLARMEEEATEGYMGYTTRDLKRARRNLKIRPAEDPEYDTEEQAIVREAFEDSWVGRRPQY
jgi:hypothetical protein